MRNFNIARSETIAELFNRYFKSRVRWKSFDRLENPLKCARVAAKHSLSRFSPHQVSVAAIQRTDSAAWWDGLLL